MVATTTCKYRSKSGRVKKHETEANSGNVLQVTSLLKTRNMALPKRKPQRPNHFFAIQVFDEKVGRLV